MRDPDFKLFKKGTEPNSRLWRKVNIKEVTSSWTNFLKVLGALYSSGEDISTIVFDMEDGPSVVFGMLLLTKSSFMADPTRNSLRNHLRNVYGSKESSHVLMIRLPAGKDQIFFSSMNNTCMLSHTLTILYYQNAIGVFVK